MLWLSVLRLKSSSAVFRNCLGWALDRQRCWIFLVMFFTFCLLSRVSFGRVFSGQSGTPWTVWNARNKRIFEGVDVDPCKAVADYKVLIEEFKSCKLRLQLGVSSSAVVTRLKPKSGFVKINCDAAVSAERGCGVGFVVSDSAGSTVLYGIHRSPASTNVELVEAEAVLWAIECCLELDISHVQVESDCVSVISKLLRRSSVKGPLKVILSRILELGSCFVSCSWSHTRKGGNQVAHHLASVRPVEADVVCFPSSFPAELFQLLNSDVCERERN